VVLSGYKSCVYGAQIAEAAKAKVPGAVTELAQLKTFYPAEAYHQQYLEKVHRGLRQTTALCQDHT
jgi:peptide methionine sulfoxide reductase MsrA